MKNVPKINLLKFIKYMVRQALHIETLETYYERKAKENRKNKNKNNMKQQQ